MGNPNRDQAVAEVIYRARRYLADAPHMDHYECYDLVRDLLALLPLPDDLVERIKAAYTENPITGTYLVHGDRMTADLLRDIHKAARPDV